MVGGGLIDEVDLAVLVHADADFGPRGPGLTARHRATDEYLLGGP